MSENIKVTHIANGVKTTREYTPEFIQEQSARLTDKFLNHCAGMAEYWADLPDRTVREKTIGVVHSILAVLDGSHTDFPAMDLVPVQYGPEEEPPMMQNICMANGVVNFENQEILSPLTTIKSGNLAFRVVNIRKESADKLAD